MLEVVQEQEQTFVLQMRSEHLDQGAFGSRPHVEDVRNRREHKAWVGERGEPDEANARIECRLGADRHLASGSGLAGARWTRDRDEAVAFNQPADRMNVRSAADEARGCLGEVVGNGVPAPGDAGGGSLFVLLHGQPPQHVRALSPAGVICRTLWARRPAPAAADDPAHSSRVWRPTGHRCRAYQLKPLPSRATFFGRAANGVGTGARAAASSTPETSGTTEP